MSEELKPCPFCGGSAYINQSGTPRVSNIIRCEDCSTIFENNATFNHHEGWNTRPIEDALREENEHLKSSLRDIIVHAMELDGYIHKTPIKNKSIKLVRMIQEAMTGD